LAILGLEGDYIEEDYREEELSFSSTFDFVEMLITIIYYYNKFISKKYTQQNYNKLNIL